MTTYRRCFNCRQEFIKIRILLFVFRREKLDKLKYIAEYNARSSNKEIEFLITQHIKNFEEIHGEIILDEPENH